MKVFELIGKLSQMPQDGEVFFIYDGVAYGRTEHAYQSKAGKIILADADQIVYHDSDRPVDAPNPKTRPYWHTEGEKRDWNYNYEKEEEYESF